MNKKTIIIILIVMSLIAIAGLSFSWFGSHTEDLNNNANVNINTVTLGNSIINTTSSQLELNIASDLMADDFADNTTPVVSNNASINVTLTSGNSNLTETCTYDIVFEYAAGSSIYGISPTVKTAGADKELTLQVTGPATGTNLFESEKDFVGSFSKTGDNYFYLVHNASIETTTSISQEWQFDFNFYNLPLDQSALKNRNFVGSIHVINVDCTNSANKNVWLSDYIINNYEILNGTDAISSNPWSVVHQIVDENTDNPIDAGYRYVGKNPDNYVWFNDELWRIIGVMDTEYCIDPEGLCNTTLSGPLVKIIRNSYIFSVPYDYKCSQVGSSSSADGSNDWSDAQLMMFLNEPKYYHSGYNGTTQLHLNYQLQESLHSNNVLDENGVIIYKNMGAYFDEEMTSYQPAKTLKSTGFTSTAELSGCTTDTSVSCVKKLTDNAQALIQSAKWDLYGNNVASNEDSNCTPNNIYKMERNINEMGTLYNSNRPTHWYGKVALPYVSDYGFAVGTDQNRESCLNTNTRSSTFQSCGTYSWLGYSYSSKSSKYSFSFTRFLTHYGYNSDSVFKLLSSGIVSTYMAYDNETIRPTLYLKPDVVLTGGSGTWDDPYTIE